eukprot:gene2828-4235_t
MSSYKSQISDDPNNKHWSTNTSNFGFKMLEKMGWKSGEGLGKNSDGSVKNITISKKDDNKGIGSNGTESNVSAKIVTYENVLKKLQPINVKEKKKKDKKDKKKKDKKRVEKYKKKIDAKLSKRSVEDYNQILEDKFPASKGKMNYEFRKRRSSQKRNVPSSSYYLGYVDDFESVEDIERKFQELERVETEIGKNLNEKEQEELYKKTSNLYLQEEIHQQLNGTHNYNDEDEYYSDFLNSDSNESDYEQQMNEDDFFENRKRKRFPFQKKKSSNNGNVESDIIHHHLGKFILQKSSRNEQDDDYCETVKIPDDPIPIPWCKTIEPLNHYKMNENGIYIFDLPKDENEENVISVKSIPKYNFQSFDKEFDAILIHPKYTISELKKLPLDKTYLMKRGYIFIWIEKENISDVMMYFEKLNFVYVENMVWVKKEMNNSFSKNEYKFTKKSKRTLFIFKKDNELTKKLDIRHQRNPDTVFDFCEPIEFVFSIIETLLFTSKQNENPFLELWAPENSKKRENWFKIHQQVE